MDFLEDRYIHHLNKPRAEYQYRHRRSQELLENLEEKEFKLNFRCAKDKVREIADVLDNNLG